MNARFGNPPLSAAPVLFGSLSDLFGKPRSRSEWEARFSHWQRPASDTEEQKIAAASRRLTKALDLSQFLATRSWSIIPQGSHHNSTNVRTDSDIDLCVCLEDAFFVDGPAGDVPSNAELGLTALPFTFQEFKSHIAACLREEFGWAAVDVGNKAIHIHKDNDDRISMDVVPAFSYRLYGPRINFLAPRSAPAEGIAFVTSAGIRVTNFPEQHYDNGCDKNHRTGRRYKRVVRIVKRIRNHIAENAAVNYQTRRRAEVTSSFLIESLIYNCPDRLFGNYSIYDDVIAVLGFLARGLSDSSNGTTLLSLPSWAYWVEVNGTKSIFGQGQAWTVTEALGFVTAAHNYMAV